MATRKSEHDKAMELLAARWQTEDAEALLARADWFLAAWLAGDDLSQHYRAARAAIAAARGQQV